MDIDELVNEKIMKKLTWAEELPEPDRSKWLDFFEKWFKLETTRKFYEWVITGRSGPQPST